MTTDGTFTELLSSTIEEVRGWDEAGRQYDHELLDQLADFVEVLANIFDADDKDGD